MNHELYKILFTNYIYLVREFESYLYIRYTCTISNERFTSQRFDAPVLKNL